MIVWKIRQKKMFIKQTTNKLFTSSGKIRCSVDIYHSKVCFADSQLEIGWNAM